jgi:hypothetical protein
MIDFHRKLILYDKLYLSVCSKSNITQDDRYSFLSSKDLDIVISNCSNKLETNEELILVHNVDSFIQIDDLKINKLHESKIDSFCRNDKFINLMAGILPDVSYKIKSIMYDISTSSGNSLHLLHACAPNLSKLSQLDITDIKNLDSEYQSMRFYIESIDQVLNKTKPTTQAVKIIFPLDKDSPTMDTILAKIEILNLFFKDTLIKRNIELSFVFTYEDIKTSNDIDIIVLSSYSELLYDNEDRLSQLQEVVEQKTPTLKILHGETLFDQYSQLVLITKTLKSTFDKYVKSLLFLNEEEFNKKIQLDDKLNSYDIKLLKSDYDKHIDRVISMRNKYMKSYDDKIESHKYNINKTKIFLINLVDSLDDKSKEELKTVLDQSEKDRTLLQSILNGTLKINEEKDFVQTEESSMSFFKNSITNKTSLFKKIYLVVKYSLLLLIFTILFFAVYKFFNKTPYLKRTNPKKKSYKIQ